MSVAVVFGAVVPLYAVISVTKHDELAGLVEREAIRRVLVIAGRGVGDERERAFRPRSRRWW